MLKYGPLLYDMDFDKSINEKLYKLEVETNDADQAIAETADATNITSEITSELNDIVSLSRDLYNTFASYTIRPALQDSIPSTSRLTSKMDKTSSLIDGSDFNVFNPSNIQKIEAYLGEMEQVFEAISEMNLDLPVGRVSPFFQQINEIRGQVLNNFSALINVTRSKIMSRRQTIEVIGNGMCGSGYGSGMYGGSMFDRFGFVKIDKYQPRRFL